MSPRRVPSLASLASFSFAFLAACTTTQQLYTGPRLPLDEGVILRETRLLDADERLLEVWKGYDTTPAVYVRQIDGLPVQAYAAEFRLLPGKHEVQVIATTNKDGLDVHLPPRTVVFESQPGGEYELRGELTGPIPNYDVLVWDMFERKEIARSR